jgi:hypothetical protein
MTKERRLKKEAIESCLFRGHEMLRWHKGKNDDDYFVTNCCKCGMIAEVILKPLPNEIEIGGEAVALNCI